MMRYTSCSWRYIGKTHHFKNNMISSLFHLSTSNHRIGVYDATNTNNYMHALVIEIDETILYYTYFVI